MATVQRPATPARPRHDSEVLLRQIDAHLTALRDGGTPGRRMPPAELNHAERVAEALRRLIVDTSLACAADRARVRAAVHCFVARGVPVRAMTNAVRSGQAPGVRADRRFSLRPDTEDRVVADLLRELGRGDLAATVLGRAGDVQAS